MLFPIFGRSPLAYNTTKHSWIYQSHCNNNIILLSAFWSHFPAIWLEIPGGNWHFDPPLQNSKYSSIGLHILSSVFIYAFLSPTSKKKILKTHFLNQGPLVELTRNSFNQEITSNKSFVHWSNPLIKGVHIHLAIYCLCCCVSLT